jgi:hypothetical protein
MIIYSLKCAKNHRFEAWFRDSSAYERQVSRRQITCPECGSAKVTKAPMAPRVARGGVGPRGADAKTDPTPDAKGASGEDAVMARKALEALKHEIEARCEYVGAHFAKEARKIHYGETDRRNIYGEASDEEAAALSDEGVEFQRIPWVRRTDS